MGILDFINSAMLGTAAYTPTKPYTGKLPTKVVRKGSSGASVKAVQTFLNWCINAGLKVDGSAGKATVKAIKKYQKKYGLKKDGIFGGKCLAKAKKIVAKYAPKPAPTPTPTKTKQQMAVDYAKKLAKDDSYHYVVYKSGDKKTKECPICHKLTGKYKGFNCIRFVFTCWHHAGIPVKHEGGLVNNDIGNKMYKSSIAKATKLAQDALGCKDIKVIRNKKGIPQNQLRVGDACMVFSGSTYKHFFLYAGDGKMVDCGRYGSDAKEIAVRKAQTCKMLIRYTGK